MKRIFLTLFAPLFAATAFAGTSTTITWTPPTTYTDNTPMPAADLKNYTVTWTRPSSTAVVGTLNVAAPASGAVVNTLVCGKYNFTVSVTTTAAAAYPNATSAASNASTFDTGINCLPNAPVLVTVVATAYQPRWLQHRLVMVAVAKVPLGVACDPNVKVAGYYKIPGSATTPKLSYAFGKCAVS